MIVATFDLTNGWTFDGQPSTMFGVRFSDGDSERIYPQGLSFGWTFGDEDYEWPPSNAVVREITSSRIFEFYFDALPEDQITVFVWAENAGVRVEAETTWTVPRPPQPYPSWTWDVDRWAAPIPCPGHPEGNCHDYAWDEDSLSWVSHPIPQD